MCKYLVGTSISREINAIIKVVKKESPDFDTQREMLCMRLEEYYKTDKAGGGKKGSKELIYRLYEISENRSIKSFWLSILTGAVISLVTSVVITIASNSSAEDSGALFAKALYVALGGDLLYTIAAIVVWGAYRHLSPYDRFHLQEQEKKLIEDVLKERLKTAHNKRSKTRDWHIVSILKAWICNI